MSSFPLLVREYRRAKPVSSKIIYEQNIPNSPEHSLSVPAGNIRKYICVKLSGVVQGIKYLEVDLLRRDPTPRLGN